MAATKIVKETPPDDWLRISTSASLGLLNGDAGAGGTLAAAMPIRRHTYLGLESGYYTWRNGAARGVPALATLTYFFEGSALRAYIGVALGLGFLSENSVTKAVFGGDVRPGVLLDAGGTSLFVENKMGVFGGEFLIAPTIGIALGF